MDVDSIIRTEMNSCGKEQLPVERDANNGADDLEVASGLRQTNLCLFTLIILMVGILHLPNTSASHLERCPHPDARASRVEILNCYVPNVTYIASLVPNARELYFYDNDITNVDVNSFKKNKRLTSVTIRKNDNLIISPKKCFINSTNLITLDISENPNIPCLSPGVFACSDKLKKVTILMNVYCECTRKLIAESNRKMNVVCDPKHKIRVPDIDYEGSKGSTSTSTSSTSTPSSVTINDDSITKPTDNPILKINTTTPAVGTKTFHSSNKILWIALSVVSIIIIIIISIIVIIWWKDILNWFQRKFYNNSKTGENTPFHDTS